MEIGLGAMAMRPDDFWSQSVAEWDARVAGFSEMNGGGGDEDSFSEDDLEALQARVADEFGDDAEQSAPD